MAQSTSAYQQAQEAVQISNAHTTTALKRWSCGDAGELPKVEQIKDIHVYDFDNTLFASPLPNRQLWRGESIGRLQTSDVFFNGGWWHDAGILASTGQGIEVEERRAWGGWWNEKIVDLVQLSMQQQDALCVLLTGRSESGFTELIKRIINSKGLKFHLICLKPEVGPSNQTFSSTMVFKQAFLSDLIRTYRQADEIRIYEDRPKHVVGFREFLEDLNQGLLADTSLNARRPIKGEVVEVSEKDKHLDPVDELAEVQKLINAHNNAFRNGTLPGPRQRWKSWQIKRDVLFTGHLVNDQNDVDKLLALAGLPTSDTKDDQGIRTMGNNIMITPRAATGPILKRAGGIGHKIQWRTSAIGKVNNPELWAVQVHPVDPRAQPYTISSTPTIVLGLRGASKPADVQRIQSRDWQLIPQKQQVTFWTSVGEKVLLTLEEEQRQENNAPAQNNDDRGFKRMRADDDFPPLGAPGSQPRPQHRNRQQAASSGPPGRGGRGGGGPGSNSRGRGGGGGARGRGGYRSLDDANKRGRFGGDGTYDMVY